MHVVHDQPMEIWDHGLIFNAERWIVRRLSLQVTAHMSWIPERHELNKKKR